MRRVADKGSARPSGNPSSPTPAPGGAAVARRFLILHGIPRYQVLAIAAVEPLSPWLGAVPFITGLADANMRNACLSLLLCLAVGGCALGGPPRSHQRDVQATPGEIVTVVAVKRVRMPSASWPVIAVGAAVGSLVGPKMLDLDSGLATIAGAAGGGAAAPFLFSIHGLEIVVRKNDGDTVAVTQRRDGWSPMIGELVQLVPTDNGPRVCTGVRDCP